jgi:hypothetical protein
MTSFSDPVHLTMTFNTLEHGAAVRWQSPILGVRHSRFVPPYQGRSLELVARALDLAQSLQDAANALSAAEQAHLAELGLWHPGGHIVPDACQRVGRTLYAALCEDPAGAQALATVRDFASAQNQPLALNLRLLPGAVELAALPWELLWDSGPVPLLLSRGRAAACTRYLDLPHALPAPRAHREPLRILALSPAADIPAAVREEERRARHAVWQPLLQSGRVQMDELGPVTREALVDRLQTRPLPDVIHYYGHGRYTDGEGALLLDSADGGPCWTSASTLMALLGGVRMVVLFACQGAMLGPASGLLTGVAPALSAAGIPLVLGMQFTVRVRAATRASGVMYRALAAGWSVQQAVSLVRQALYVEENDRASWYVPVLYVRAHEPAPVYLVGAREEAATQAGPASTAVPGPAARQAVVARQNSRASAINMQGSSAAQQAISATEDSSISRVGLRAQQAAQQDVQAEAASDISDVKLEA